MNHLITYNLFESIESYKELIDEIDEIMFEFADKFGLNKVKYIIPKDRSNPIEMTYSIEIITAGAIPCIYVNMLWAGSWNYTPIRRSARPCPGLDEIKVKNSLNQLEERLKWLGHPVISQINKRSSYISFIIDPKVNI